MTDVRSAQTIALDGPAAAGKSTVGRRLAERLGYLYFDTGCLYRALTLLALERDVATGDAAALAALAEGARMEVTPAPGCAPGYAVSVDGRDITAALRDEAVNRAVPVVSRHALVRAALLARQREVAARGPVVMVGRDIGTVVMPDADMKVFLEASAAERAVRRYREQLRSGDPACYGDVLAEVRRRDETDSGRDVAPLARAPDAVVVASDDCAVDEVVAHIEALVRRWPDELTAGGGEAPCAATAEPDAVGS